MIAPGALLQSLLIDAWLAGDFKHLSAYNGKSIDFPKQQQAFAILADKETEYFVYGGAAGGGKSWTGCSWLINMSLAYPGTRWFIGREELKRLRESTLQTFYKVAHTLKLKIGEDYKYNGQDHFIEFDNGSRIDLLELKYLPSDPLYERYGSVEYTGGWIEEGGEVHFDAFDTLKSRIGRHLNDRYGIKKKIFITCNPKKNWLYHQFYEPWNKRDKATKWTVEVPDSDGGVDVIGYAFLQALAGDNPLQESGYISGLRSISNQAKKQRLLFGNWDYDDDPSALIDYASILDFFTNKHVPAQGHKYMTADIAMQGSDRFVICIWHGWVIIKIVIIDKSSGVDVLQTLERLSTQNGVARSNIAFDNDGIGSYLSSFLQGAYPFVNGGRPVYQNRRHQDQYQHLKAQCYYHFAAKVMSKEAYFAADLELPVREQLETEMAWIKNSSIGTDKKLSVLKKEEIKEAIGRSPDLTDALMMRSVFDLKKGARGITTRS